MDELFPELVCEVAAHLGTLDRLMMAYVNRHWRMAMSTKPLLLQPTAWSRSVFESMLEEDAKPRRAAHWIAYWTRPFKTDPGHIDDESPDHALFVDFFRKCGQHRAWNSLRLVCRKGRPWWCLRVYTVNVIEALIEDNAVAGKCERFLKDVEVVLGIMEPDGNWDEVAIREGTVEVHYGRPLQHMAMELNVPLWNNLGWVNSA